MSYRLEPAVLPDFGRVDKVVFNGRWVGFLRQVQSPLDQGPPTIWFAHYGGVSGHGVNSREEGLNRILRFAEEHPDFVMQ